ncbi:hypothetical protein HMPREF9123_1302 [Neisseria bacilliformis ATCC BAA-1200]|uniref:Uncharacterized protein n=1 Tax=Neisseria bacilliformis ATCC BAA-1200 TaxID=888742 RepID=F2BC47_9NEIS|nr:hypothetical protein HMPREF9123_1302 [Neisseria bacilliformis ATCC BAA-1200]
MVIGQPETVFCPFRLLFRRPQSSLKDANHNAAGRDTPHIALKSVQNRQPESEFAHFC